MRRLAAFWPVFLLLLALSFGAPQGSPSDSTPDAIKARLQEKLDGIAATSSPRVLVIPVREIIDTPTAVFVEQQMRRLKARRIDLVLVDLHTPGGSAFAAGRICGVLSRSLTDQEVPVITFINTDAFSAGAYISLATDRIYIAPSGKIGAATGWQPGPDGTPITLPPDIMEKQLSGQRADVRSLAKVKGYPPAIAMAMVDRSQVVTEVEIDGKREYLSEKEFENRRRELGLDKLTPFEAEKRVKVVRTVCEKDELLTLDYEEAKNVGLAATVVDSREGVFNAMGLRNPVVVEATPSWSETFFGFLASAPVRAVLLLLGLMGLYMEFKIPGFGFPGIFGLSCLGLFFFSQYFMGIADYTGVVIFLIGVVLLVIEIFLIPGFGITGITGIVLVVVGLFLAMQPFVIPDVRSPWDMTLFTTNVMILAGALAALVVAMIVLAKVLPATPVLNRLILTSRGPEGELRASGTVEPNGLVRAGATGRTLSRLRPAGRADFDGKFLDVVAEGQFIGEGVTVEVIKIQGNRIVVREVG